MSRPRAYHVFCGREPALTIEDRPGRLHSMAALPEGQVAPEHPFIQGVSLSPLFEHALRQVLLASANFNDFVTRLVADGYDLAASTGESPFHLGGPKRLVRASDGTLGGAVWPAGGQLSSLVWQPEPGADVYPHGLATAYIPELVQPLRQALQAARDPDDVIDALEAQGWTLTGAGR